jgi:hypothetical protein
MNYKIVNGRDGKLVGVFEPTIGCIPPDPANTDYQEYLRFLAEGGQPLPADDDGQAAE